MGNPDVSARRPSWLKGVASFLFWAVVFGLAYTQGPLYFSNQNQYFLHGLAKGGLGNLGKDWLANTADPTPLFSTVVALTYRHGHEALFYAYYILLFGVYFQGMVGVFTAVAGPRATPAARACFIVLLLVSHSAAVRWLSWRLLDGDYPWFLQTGVANQYVLGPSLQPSVFGVFLVLSVALFLQDRPLLAVLCSSGAAAVHATYVPGAALLTLAYLWLLLRERRHRTALLVGLAALAVVTPTLIHHLVVFGPTSAEAFARAEFLLAQVRVPHHSQPTRWLDWIAVLQVFWIAAAWRLVRHERLGFIFAFVALLTLVLTLLQVFTESNTLALLFPWRTTAYLVPLATAVIFTVVAVRMSSVMTVSNTFVQGGAAVIIVLLAALGTFITVADGGYNAADDGQALLDHVRDTKQPDDLYLVPARLPTPHPVPRSSIPPDFKPASPANAAAHPLSFDLQRFRLSTGAPIYIDFKSIPYRDVEVLEWFDRVLWTDRFYHQLGADSLGKLHAELRQRGITYVVVRDGLPVHSCELAEVFAGDGYRLYRVKP